MAELHTRAARALPPRKKLERKGLPDGRPSATAPRPPASGYDRRRAIARVLPLWPHELEDESATARKWIVAKLHSALRAERRRGVAGHWTYDLARHVELLRVYRQELAALTGLPDDGQKPEEP